MSVLRPIYINRRATETKGFMIGFSITFFEVNDSSGQTLWNDALGLPECKRARIKQ